jgi:hypothetical protein
MSTNPSPQDYVSKISGSGLTIYDPIEIGDPELWIPAPELEVLLDSRLRDLNLSGLPLRTRSKVVKAAVCEALGYPTPRIFKKTQPRFLGQRFDTYVQKSHNLQIWNEELALIRRYVIIRVSADDRIIKVKVVTGDALAKLDTTGTLTQKYQARLVCGNAKSELISPTDTDIVSGISGDPQRIDLRTFQPTSSPSVGRILPISAVFERLRPMIGVSFPDRGHDQERRRGGDLHKIVCAHLGFSNYADDGQFPDIRSQLLEIKLQTSPTIDLGLVRPDSTEPLDLPKINELQIRHCDVRYALFYGRTDGHTVTLTHFFLTIGKRFFHRFHQFQGRVLNKKLQIPLPRDFFD